MSPLEEEDNKNPALPKEKYDEIMNRVAVAFAKHEEVVKGWMAKWGGPQRSEKTMEELIAEDAIIFQPRPQQFGGKVPFIPAKYLISDAERNDKDLRAKFLPSKGLKASQSRDAEGNASSAKRAPNEQSSDEEEGRSGLGRTKKRRIAPAVMESVKVATSAEDVPMHTGAETGTSELKPKVQEFTNKSILNTEKEEETVSRGRKKKHNSKPASQGAVHPAALLQEARNRASEGSRHQELALSLRATSPKAESKDDEKNHTRPVKSDGVIDHRRKSNEGLGGDDKANEPKNGETGETTEIRDKIEKQALKKEKKKQRKRERREEKKRAQLETTELASSD